MQKKNSNFKLVSVQFVNENTCRLSILCLDKNVLVHGNIKLENEILLGMSLDPELENLVYLKGLSYLLLREIAHLFLQLNNKLSQNIYTEFQWIVNGKKEITKNTFAVKKINLDKSENIEVEIQINPENTIISNIDVIENNQLKFGDCIQNIVKKYNFPISLFKADIQCFLTSVLKLENIEYQIHQEARNNHIRYY